MDAQAYLRKHGWRGDGHSLDQSGRGIKKPLLVSKKVDVLGLGLNKHAAVSDQWWLRAFDNGLKNFGTGQESMLAAVQKHGVNRGGLYGRFVQGEGVAGTFEMPVVSPDQDTSPVPAVLAGTALESTSRQQNDRKRKHAEDAMDKQQSKKQKSMTVEGRRQDEINQAARALVVEAEARGIIPTGKQKRRAVETDSNDPLFEMIKTTSLNEHIQTFETGDPSSEAYKAAESQVKREFELAAKAYLSGAIVPQEPSPPVSRKPAKSKEANKKIAAKSERDAKKQRRLAKKANDMDAIITSKLSKGQRLTVREAASGCGISQKHYVARATGKTYSQYVKDNEIASIKLEDWVELHRKIYS
nr:protein tma23 [Quercus suber]